MKVLAVSDIHGDRKFMEEMAQKGKDSNVDLVIIAGDVAAHDGNIDGLIGPFKAQGLEVAIIPGNHEGLAEINFLAERYKIKNLHGYSMVKNKVGIFGCGYADAGLHQLTEKDFHKTLKTAHESVKDAAKKIMVSHIQPSNSIIGMGIFGGSTSVRKLIEEIQPDIHICGHIHETEGIEEKIGKTRVINVGKKGKIIEI